MNAHCALWYSEGHACPSVIVHPQARLAVGSRRGRPRRTRKVMAVPVGPGCNELFSTRPRGPRRRPHQPPRKLDHGLARSILYKLQLGPPEGPDFKFELLPLHSPLLRQSLLVSFPPLIDMLKFSGYPYLIRGQTLEVEVDWPRRTIPRSSTIW